ncbi:MAG: redox-regulated ATPase YchF [Armatimonadetes bacterium]|nr:redox-regulated ATPase YchF [Armatimonadota bacterium]
MSLQVGIVGLPNAGKSTLFNALTRAAVETAAYPFTTIQPNLGVVAVPDPRLAQVAAVTHPKRVVPATIQFVDIAGLVRGAHRGEGLGNQFLSHIREVDALAHVVRCFPLGDVAHPEGSVDPRRDMGIIETELALADLQTLERARERAAGRVKAADRHAREHLSLLDRVAAALNEGRAARALPLRSEERAALRDLRLLTDKPVIYVANVEEDAAGRAHPLADAVHARARESGAGAVTICARLEAEVAALSPEEAREFLAAAGIEEPGLARLIRSAHALLGLVTFFSTASEEVRAWPVPRGTTAQRAAGQIHTDMERGFIRAEAIAWEALVAAGSLHAARERGLMRLEGKEYLVADGDVVHFRFAV